MKPEDRLTRLLHETFDNLPGLRAEPGSLRINPAIDPEEAKDFFDGLDAGLFQIEENGFVSSPLLPPPRVGQEQQKTLQLFWSQATSPHCFREGVCQVAAACALVLRSGWAVESVRLEPYKEDIGGLAYGVDLVVWNDEREIVILGEVKRNKSLLKGMLRDLRSCAEIGPHDRASCDRRGNHPKFETCWSLKPEYFWAVAPGQRTVFQMEYEEKLELSEIEQLPSPDGLR